MKGREIVQRAGLDVQALVTALNKAYCGWRITNIG